MGNCCGVAVEDGGSGAEMKTRMSSESFARSASSSSSSSSCNSMEAVDRREARGDFSPGETTEPANYKDIFSKRGTLSYGAAKIPQPRCSREMETFDEKMPLQTLNFKRGKFLGSSSEAGLGDVELGEDSSQLGFDRVLDMWQEERKAKKKSEKKGIFSSLGKAGTKDKKKPEKLMMWETFLRSKKVRVTP